MECLLHCGCIIQFIVEVLPELYLPECIVSPAKMFYSIYKYFSFFNKVIAGSVSTAKYGGSCNAPENKSP